MGAKRKSLTISTGGSSRGRGDFKRITEPVVRTHLVDSLSDLLSSCGLVVLCAGPGMGKSVLMDQLGARETARGRCVRVHSFGGDLASEELRRFSRFSRSIVIACGKQADMLTILEDVPPFDERELKRFYRAVSKLLAAGCPVVMTMRPESSQVLDVVDPNAAIVRGVRLCVEPEELSAWDLAVPAPTVDKLTGGVPALVDAVRTSGGRHVRGEKDIFPDAYDCALSKQLTEAMRSSVMHDERRLRLLMLLLGRGRAEDLEDGSGLAEELFLDISADEPLFGIDMSRGTFQVAGRHHMVISRTCREALMELASGEQDVVESAIEMLVVRDDFERAGFAAALLENAKSRAQLILPHAMRYLDAGHVGLVREAAELDWEGDTSHSARIAQAAIAALDGDEESYERLRADIPKAEGSLQQSQRALLDDLHRACLTNRRAVHMSAPVGPAQDMSSRLRRHVIVRAMMVQGKFREAFDELLGARIGSGGSGLSETLLLADAECLGILLGDECDLGAENERSVAAELFKQMELDDFALYHVDFLSACRALCDKTEEFEGQERCLLRAERRGDKLLLCAAGLVAAILDMRRSAYLRAHLRCERVSSLAVDVGATFLHMLAQAVDALGCRALGEDVLPIDIHSAFPRGWRETAAIISACTRGNEADVFQAAQRLPAAGPPLGAEFILDLALHHLGSESATLNVVLPTTWRRAARLPLHPSVERPLEHSESCPTVDLLEVRLLGGFEVRLGGDQIPLAMWERGSARSLLAAICTQHGHKLSRAQAIEMLWPELDYMRGRNNLYSTVSSIRRTIGQTATGPQYLLGKEELMLDMAYVRCDVDQLEELAVKVLAREGGDLAIIRNCEGMQALYRGDLDIPLAENSQLVVARRTELRELYVDCMIVGAETALALDSIDRTVWFARSARRVDPLREDALALLLRAYTKQGRILDARSEYEGYANELISVAAVPPSRALRELARDIGVLGGDAEKDGPFELISAIG